MNRRDLLKKIPLFSVAPFLKPESLTVSEYRKIYRGFQISWTGWLRPPAIHAFVGQWMALNPKIDKMSVYSAYPGVTGTCFPGFMLNTSMRDNQNIPGPWSTPVELESYRSEAYHRLIRYLDMVYEEIS